MYSDHQCQLQAYSSYMDKQWNSYICMLVNKLPEFNCKRISYVLKLANALQHSSTSRNVLNSQVGLTQSKMLNSIKTNSMANEITHFGILLKSISRDSVPIRLLVLVMVTGSRLIGLPSNTPIHSLCGMTNMVQA